MTCISIALCTYNGATYLEEQLDSILKQTLQPLELRVGDDGSTDTTLDILDRFAATAPFPVIVTRNPVNLGYGENFIQTAKRCAGDWIAFCDQDDVWLPAKLERCNEFIEHGPADLKLVVHNAETIDPAGEYNRDMMKGIGYDWSPSKTYAKHELPPHWMMYGNCMVFDRSLVHDISSDGRAWPCFNAEPHESHDSWIPILAAVLGSVTATSDQLIQYRRHGSNASIRFVSPTFKQRVTSKLLPDPDYFEAKAHQLCSLAERLAERAPTAGRESYKVDLRSASRRYHDLGRAYALRAEVARGPSMAARFQAFRKLVGSGIYSMTDGWGFRKSGLIKDLLHTLVGRAIGPFRS